MNGDGLDGAMRASTKKGFGFGVTGHVAPDGAYQSEGAIAVCGSGGPWVRRCDKVGSYHLEVIGD